MTVASCGGPAAGHTSRAGAVLQSPAAVPPPSRAIEECRMQLPGASGGGQLHTGGTYYPGDCMLEAVNGTRTRANS